MSAEKITYRLQYPIQWGDDYVTELEFRRMRLKDMRKLPDDDMENLAELLSRLTGHPPSLIAEIDMTELDEIKEIIQGFLPKSQRTGKKQSDGLPTE